MSILVTGSLAYDRIMDFPGRFREHMLPEKIHVLNVSFVIERFEEKFGGTAGNIAYNLMLLGIDLVLVATAGKDFKRYGAYLEQSGISTKHVKIIEDEYTALAHIITDMDGNQISAFYPGALNFGAANPLPKGESDDVLIISPSSAEEMGARRKEAQNRKIRYVFDPGQQITALSAEELSLFATDAAVSIFNDYEWHLFESKTGLSLDGVAKGESSVIITKGAEGSVIHAVGTEYTIGAARPAVILDPTGAGDAYRAGLLAGMVYGWDWQTTGQVAATLASFAVEQYGTQAHAPDIASVRERYEKNFSKGSFPKLSY